MASSKPSASSSVTLVIAPGKSKTNYVNPALVTFPDVRPSPSGTKFELFGHKSNDRAPPVLVAETDELEFRSDPQVDTSACTYMLGLHSAKAGQLTLFPTRFHHLRPVVKRLRESDEARLSEGPTSYYEARNLLGATFGTKKSRRAFQAAARSRVDPESMSHLEGQISASIAENSSCLPSAMIQAQETDASRPIPPFNKDATDPKDVYSLDDVVSNLELNSIPLEPILKATNYGIAAKCLPFPQSKYVNYRLKALWERFPQGQLDKKETKRLRILVYINYLMSVRQLRKFSRDSISQRLSTRSNHSSIPDSIVGGILNRFTETVRGDDGSLLYKTTTFSSLKLLSYTAVLCLIHDDFSTRMMGLQEDLEEPIRRVNEIFRGLGCRLEKLSIPEIEDANEGMASSENHELSAQRALARLEVPLQFPALKTRKRRKQPQ